MSDVIDDTHIGLVLLIENHPYRFPLLIMVLAIIGGCIFSPLLRDKQDSDD